MIARSTPGPVARLGSGALTYARTYTSLRFGVRDEEAAALARTKIVAALDRLEAELGSNEYLVGDSFSVADLTAAALFFPLVLPEEGPVPTDEPPAAGHRELPRAAAGAPRLPLGRRYLPQAPAPRRRRSCRIGPAVQALRRAFHS